MISKYIELVLDNLIEVIVGLAVVYFILVPLGTVEFIGKLIKAIKDAFNNGYRS